ADEAGTRHRHAAGRRLRVVNGHKAVLPAIRSVWNIIVTVDSANLERPNCPRCGSATARHVVDGTDRLHASGLSASIVECVRCGLWFQSPRLPSSRYGELYPPGYAP